MIHVTEAIKLCGLSDMEFVTEFGLNRGTAVHVATALDDKGDLDESTVDPIHVRPYLESWRLFKNQCGVVIREVERKVVNTALDYEGTLDRILELDRALIVADLKCGQPAPWHPYQLAGYAMAWQAEMGGSTPARLGVYLDDQGKLAKSILYTDRRDFEKFKAIVTVANIVKGCK